MVVAVGDRRARPSRRTVASQSVSQASRFFLQYVLLCWSISISAWTFWRRRKQASTERQVRRESICGD